MRGKLIEGIKVSAAMLPENLTAITVYYNGNSITFGSGIGFDTQPYDDVVVGIMTGTVLGIGPFTLQNALYESDTDDPSASTLLSGAAFADRNSTDDESLQLAAVHTADTKRYLFVRTEAVGGAGLTCTIHYGAFFIGGKADSQATSNTLEFDL